MHLNPLSEAGSYQPWRGGGIVKVAVLSSGGKDSNAALWWAQCKGWEVSKLVTMLVTGEDSWMFQVPGTSLVEHQAKLCGIEWLPVETKGIVDEEINDLETALSQLEIDGIVSGAIRSDYQKTRLERMCERLGIKSFTPLWHQPPHLHMDSLIENRFEVMLTGVAAEGLGKEWVGRILDLKTYGELKSSASKYRFQIDGEGGEYESLVVAGPHMRGRLLLDFEAHWNGSRGHLSVKQVRTQG